MIFVDRSIPRGVAQALQAVRDDVIWLEDRFAHDAKDPVWLREAGRNGWLVLCRDKKVRSRPGERQAIVDNSVGCFCLTQKQPLTRWEYLKLIVTSLDEMERVFAHARRPFIYGVNAAGQLRRIA